LEISHFNEKLYIIELLSRELGVFVNFTFDIEKFIANFYMTHPNIHACFPADFLIRKKG